MLQRHTRACGSCSACCRSMAVHELKKDAWTRCTHLCDGGCGIYPERPASCRNFSCQWLRGVLEVDGTVDPGLRPDACGVIFDYQPESPYGQMYTAWEVRPGASARSPAREVIEGLAEHFSVMLVSPAPEGAAEPSIRRLVSEEPLPPSPAHGLDEEHP